MKLKLLIYIFSLGFCLSVQAAPSCTETKIEIKDSELEKIFIKKVSDKETELKFLFGKEVVIANPFFCYQRKGYVECLGDDDSGRLIIKQGHLNIKRLTIRTNDDTHHVIKESQKTFTVQEIPCKDMP